MRSWICLPGELGVCVGEGEAGGTRALVVSPALTFFVFPPDSMPATEALRRTPPPSCPACVTALTVDAEDNGALAARAALDAHKAFRGGASLATRSPPSSTLWRGCMPICPALVAAHVDPPAGGGAPTPRALPGELPPAARSFAVLADAPLHAMFLLNLYPRLAEPAITALVPSMAAAVALAGPGSPAAVAAAAAAAAGAPCDPSYADLKGAQVKTLSFLTYLLRQLPARRAPVQDALAPALVAALATAPDAVPQRKELLVALRHALTTPLPRRVLRPTHGALLDEARCWAPGGVRGPSCAPSRIPLSPN